MNTTSLAPRIPVCLLLFVSLVFTTQADDGRKLDLLNSGFEEGTAHWRINPEYDRGMTVISSDGARTGQMGARITDQSEEYGSSLESQLLPATPGNTYILRFHGRLISGEGIGVYLRFFDVDGKPLTNFETLDEIQIELRGEQNEWMEYALSGIAPEGAVELSVWVHSYNQNIVTADVDDFSLSEISAN